MIKEWTQIEYLEELTNYEKKGNSKGNEPCVS
jgi:hypothetical protein